MGSFWDTLGKDLKIIGKVALAVEPLAVDAISLFDPPLALMIGGIAGKVSAAVANAEQSPADGATKKANVISDFTSALALAQTITGKKFTFDNSKLEKVIDATVSGNNIMADFVASVKEVV